MYDRVLVPLDGSAMAEIALTHAEGVIARGGRLVLMHVVPPGAPAAAADDARAYLTRLREEVEGPEVSVATRVVDGDPAERLIEASREFDVVVLSTHGRTERSRSLIARVTDQVVRHASVPVLLVRQADSAGEKARG